jgi:HSP20 family molecular chaperone IbpA
MTDNDNHPSPVPTGERKLLRWILVLQVVILAWLAKNYFDGASHRSNLNPPAVATSPDTPPSLEPSASPDAPSSFSVFPHFFVTQSAPPVPRFRHPADRMRDEMEHMLAEANRAFSDFDSFFGPGPAWAALPASPAMNLRELDDAYELALALPDADPESLDVRLDGRLLSVASRQNTRTPNSASSQSFSTRLLLPGPVDSNAAVKITNENNRICIRIPKPAAATASRQP